jgi:hypothetical protein
MLRIVAGDSTNSSRQSLRVSSSATGSSCSARARMLGQRSAGRADSARSSTWSMAGGRLAVSSLGGFAWLSRMRSMSS